jgi:4-amino-4-deoxy-L-arabinose transferase-like glycosyltransferase
MMKGKLSVPGFQVLLPLSIVLLAALSRIYGVSWGLPDVYEEATPLRTAWEMWGWGPARHLDLNPHFFNYPSLTIYLQFLAQGILYLLLTLAGRIHSTIDFRVLYTTDPTAFLVMGRAVTILFAAGTVYLVYAIGRRVGGLACAVPAALLLALNPVHMAQSVVVEVDVPLAFFVTLSLMYMMRILETPTRRDYLMAGLAAGLATSAKYTGALVLVPLLIAHLVARRTRPHKGGKKAIRGATWGWLAVGGVAALVAFAVTSPFVFLDSKSFWHDLTFERTHMRLGQFGGEASSTWLYYAGALVKRVLGWPCTLLMVGGLGYLLASKRRAWTLVLAGFLVPMWIMISSWNMKADRYLIPLIPAALLICGGMLAEWLSILKRRSIGTVAQRAVAVGAVVVLLAGSAGGSYVYRNRLRPDPRTEARMWITTHVPSGSLIVTETLGPNLLDPLHLAPLEPELRARILKSEAQGVFYAVQVIPMFQVGPERSEAFYDLGLYEVADVIVTTSQVSNRYRDDPGTYRRQVAFYDSLGTRFEKAAEFRSPAPGARVITLYRNPRQSVPFANRRPVQGPVALRPASSQETGEETFFYYNLGLNYEAFGFLNEAVSSYSQALQYKRWRPRAYGSLVLAMTRCLFALGRPEDAARFADASSAKAPYAEDRDMILQMRQRLASRPAPNR